MLIVDAHCDTVSRVLESNTSLLKNNFHLDIVRMKKYEKYVQFFASFINPSHGDPMKKAIALIDRYFIEIEKNSEHIMHCNKYTDIENALQSGKIASLLSIEGGEALMGQLASLRMFYRLGVRSICLTWNYRNEIADGVKDSISGGGLTSFGREVVKEMNRLGMLIDLSHISERGFWDCLDVSTAPVIVSHSNARALCNHPRNLTDEQLTALKNKGGVVGINFYPLFLNNSGEASITDIIKHIEYMAGLIGTEYLGLGSDFDGIEKTPAGFDGVQCMDTLINKLLKLNYSENDVENIMGMNLLRLMEKVL
ncbi:MAG TPA: membrane dipeptidase [Clostridiaceae bacterium]|jgi:membrane dipeptidase|nr:membrane dipeptidase [Clostridiaceae bacterium]